MFVQVADHKTSSDVKIILIYNLKRMDNQKIGTSGGTLINDPGTEQSLQKNLPGHSGVSSLETSDEAFDLAFRPKGAVMFFALLIILGMVIWFGIYFLMLSRI